MPAEARFRGPLLGEEREFCCAGCRAVAEAIAAAGLAEYYNLRTEAAPHPGRLNEAGGDPPHPPAREEGKDFLFDREDLQKDFVRREDGISEASFVLDG
ncbi:MAG TPA: heavy metal translocating P-type ATPase metal-binding domain-containing protein, partial [Thermoanaerobaculia bacterium]|nr:heavy metal translocating P-type ATPase metal-binding domain-containing protein [Thermoanaerobaculia bacterium]